MFGMNAAREARMRAKERNQNYIDEALHKQKKEEARAKFKENAKAGLQKVKQGAIKAGKATAQFIGQNARRIPTSADVRVSYSAKKGLYKRDRSFRL